MTTIQCFHPHNVYFRIQTYTKVLCVCLEKSLVYVSGNNTPFKQFDNVFYFIL